MIEIHVTKPNMVWLCEKNGRLCFYVNAAADDAARVLLWLTQFEPAYLYREIGKHVGIYRAGSFVPLTQEIMDEQEPAPQISAGPRRDGKGSAFGNAHRAFWGWPLFDIDEMRIDTTANRATIVEDKHKRERFSQSAQQALSVLCTKHSEFSFQLGSSEMRLL